MKTNKKDFAHFLSLHPYISPSDIPITFTVGNRKYSGFPPDTHPTAERTKIDSCVTQTIIRACTDSGLRLRAECAEYRDYPVVEWLMYIENIGKKDSEIISDWYWNETFHGTSPVLYHGNGDTMKDDGYEWYRDPVTEAGITKMPCQDGTSCNGAFPYMRLQFSDSGINIAIGWTGNWKLTMKLLGDKIHMTAGQAQFASFLHPGETVRSPRLTLEAFDGTDDRGRNLWRSFYIDHILPRENGQPIKPKLVLHTLKAGGLPEFCGITEENQIRAIDTFIKGGLKPDIWWIDAGWYPCGNNWRKIGNWYPNPDNLPNGLSPIGEKCRKEGIAFLLWFEPERVFENTDLWNNHPEWLLFSHSPDNDWLSHNAILNIGNPAVCDHLIDAVDKMIKEFGIGIYRQDFNIAPQTYWYDNDGENRTGITENLHIQGYYRYWDTLLDRNPGLIIDSCASGGRRNDLETMRRSVALHYTDVGYGNHCIKQKQHRQMFEWIPYFRAHNMNWDEPDGSYNRKQHKVDEFGYQNALAPSVTSMIEWYDTDSIYAEGRRFHPIWRRAAQVMLSGDYYPLTECRKSAKDWYALQFDDETEGFIQIIRNVHVSDDTVTINNLHIDTTQTYIFEDLLNNRSFLISGIKLKKEGFTDTLPVRSGVIWFYSKSRE